MIISVMAPVPGPNSTTTLACGTRADSTTWDASCFELGAIDPTSPFPNLEGFLLHGDGQISVGKIGPIRCAAVANDNHNMLTALQRRDDETLMQLLQRLDAALLRALEHDEFIDEING